MPTCGWIRQVLRLWVCGPFLELRFWSIWVITGTLNGSAGLPSDAST